MANLPTTPAAARAERVLAQAEDLLSSTTVIGEFTSWELSKKVEEAAYQLRVYADLLEQHAQALEAQRWIPVEERLPEEGVEVQVAITQLTDVGTYRFVLVTHQIDGEWRSLVDGERVTHWQKLPAPPAAPATAQAGGEG